MPEDGWIALLNKETAELELKASWASQVGYDKVRDLLRSAIYELRKQIDIRRDNMRK